MIDTKKILNFIKELKENNKKEWYHAHKEERLEANIEFEKLIQELIIEIGKFDESILNNHPKDLTFKMVRDTRFSKDKSPYNPVFRAHISSRGKLPIPVGYYIYIGCDNTIFLGGGLFADMFKDATNMVRSYIDKNGKELDEIINDPSFKNNFEMCGVKLKNVPAGYDKEHPYGEFLKHKSWFIEYPISDKDFMDSEAFIKNAAETFKLMKPFNDYLNKALVDFEMPKR
ncbi:DUF2461 domain-containing protein [uncultured Anaerofustis sp.]|uniref:DUF2461 domain-containing protein n=1 Tax=uncultured Anaerofustis sp. TaxID=904996 RepID=UPI0025CD7657|nr:DUF2461 domain-containing protein [uncultured Anaerofustis sp.]